MAQPIRVSGKVRLRDFNPRFCAGLEKEPTIMETDRLLERFGKLQDLFYANANRGLIIVLQGMDTSGKDGTARRLFEFVEPAGVATVEFKAPSALELAHDYLWRVHQAVPRFGRIGLFNRSHYEDVRHSGDKRHRFKVMRFVLKALMNVFNEFQPRFILWQLFLFGTNLNHVFGHKWFIFSSCHPPPIVFWSIG